MRVSLMRCMIAGACCALSGIVSPSEARLWVVDQAAVNASDNNGGTAADPYLTINKAAQMANAGDTVLVHAGVYRERVAPARGGTSTAYITYMAAPGDTVVIKGSKVWTTATWSPVAGMTNVYAAVLDQTLFDATYKPFEVALAGGYSGHTLGQIFLNGMPCREVSNYSAVLTNQEYVCSYRTSDKAVMVHVPAGTSPADYTIEISVRERVFAPTTRGLGYIRVKGFVMEHAANQFPESFWSKPANKQAGLIGCMSGNHWIIEDNVIRYAKSIGIDCGNEGSGGGSSSSTGYHIIRNNVVAYCGCTGIMGQYSASTQITGNVVVGANYHLQSNIPESAGMKFHSMNNGLFEHNLIMNCDCFALWLDAGCRTTRITRNVSIGNRGNGYFVELTQGPIIVDNNIAAQSRFQFYAKDPEGDGIYTHDASGITVAHNLCYADTGFSLTMRVVTNRQINGAVSQISNNKVYNNIFINGAQGTMHFPYPGPLAVNNAEDANLFTDGLSFMATTYGGTSIDTIQARWATVCAPDTFSLYTDRENRSGDTIPRSGRIGQTGGQQYGARCTLAQWQKLTGYGAHDAPHGITGISLSRETLTLAFTIGDAPWNTQTVVVDSVKKDFFGTAMPATGRLPGPFQNLQRGANTIALWDGPAAPALVPTAARYTCFYRAGSDDVPSVRTGRGAIIVDGVANARIVVMHPDGRVVLARSGVSGSVALSDAEFGRGVFFVRVHDARGAVVQYRCVVR